MVHIDAPFKILPVPQLFGRGNRGKGVRSERKSSEQVPLVQLHVGNTQRQGETTLVNAEEIANEPDGFRRTPQATG